MAADYTILITTSSTAVVGDPITCWTTIDITLKFNEPATGLFTAPAHDWIMLQLQDGRRVVIIRDGEILMAGPWEKILHERADDGENGGVGRVTVNFTDDLAAVVARQVYPSPTLAPAAQVADVWTYTGNAELALRSLVNLNAGPGALTARRVTQLSLGALATVGSSITVTAQRMQPMGDLMRDMAAAGGQLGFRTRQSGNSILFEVYAPPAKPGVRFGFDYGNLRYIATERSAPSVTAAIVGGQGEGTSRALIERVDTAAQTTWGRLETLVSRDGNGPAGDLNDDGDKALAAGAATTRLASNAADTEAQRYGIDYDLGDIVTIESGPGQQVTDIITTVHIAVYATAGEVISPYIGDQSARTDPYWIQQMQALNDRIGQLERTVVPAVP